MVREDHSAQREVIAERQVEGQVRVVIGIAARGNAITGIRSAFGDTDLRLVGNVTDRASLGTATKERTLRSFEYLDTLHVYQVDVIVARRELHRLVIEVQRNVRERSGR